MGTSMLSESSEPLERRKDRSRSPGVHSEHRRRRSKSSSTRDLTSTGRSSGATRKSRSSHHRTTPAATSTTTKSPRARSSTRTRSAERRRNSPSSSQIRQEEYTKSPRIPSNRDADDSDSDSSNSDSSSSATSSSDEEDVPKTPASAYLKSSRRFNLSTRPATTSETPTSQTPGGTSSKGPRRRIKYQASTSTGGSSNIPKAKSVQRKSDGATMQSEPLKEPTIDNGEEDGGFFEVKATSGNISTWEMRQRFQREFPNEPIPSDAILRQLYRGEKVAEYERKERYKQEFPGEPIPSDEVLQKLFAVRPVDVGPLTSPSRSFDTTDMMAAAAKAKPIQREALLSRQHSESNMTFTTEAGWDGFGKSSKQMMPSAKPSIPLSIGLGALVEGDDGDSMIREESIAGATWKTPNFDRSMQFPVTTSPDPSKIRGIGTVSSNSEVWAHSFHGMTSLPEPNRDPSHMEWADAFPKPTLKPCTVVRRHSDSSLNEDPGTPHISSPLDKLKKRPSSHRKSVTRSSSSGHNVKKRVELDDNALQAFNDSFGSINSFDNEKSSQHHHKSPRVSGTKSQSKKKEKVAKISKASKSKRNNKKPKSKRSSSLDNAEQQTDFHEICAVEALQTSPGAKKSSPSNDKALRPSPKDKSGNQQDEAPAWLKRESWKQNARTRSAPLAPVEHNMASQEDLERSFSGDLVASFEQQQPQKSQRRGRKSEGAAARVDDLEPTRAVGRSKSGGLSGSTRNMTTTTTTMNWHQSTPDLGFHGGGCFDGDEDAFLALAEGPASIRRSRKTGNGIDRSSGHSTGRGAQKGNTPSSSRSKKNLVVEEFTSNNKVFATTTAITPVKPHSSRQTPGRSKSAEFPAMNLFDDLVPKEPQGAPPPPPEEMDAMDVLAAGVLLQPSKRDYRRSRSADRPRSTKLNTTTTAQQQQQNQRYHSSANLADWSMDIPGILKQSTGQDDDSDFELHVEDGNHEPLSPLTMATKKPLHRPMISRRRGY